MLGILHPAKDLNSVSNETWICWGPCLVDSRRFYQAGYLPHQSVDSNISSAGSDQVVLGGGRKYPGCAERPIVSVCAGDPRGCTNVYAIVKKNRIYVFFRAERICKDGRCCRKANYLSERGCGWHSSNPSCRNRQMSHRVYRYASPYRYSCASRHVIRPVNLENSLLDVV